jgi:hypothetical protein
MVHAADKEELPVSSSGAERHEEKKPERPLAASSSIQQQQQEAASSSAVRSSAPYEAAIEGLSSLEITSGMEGEKKKKAKPPKKPVVAHPLSPEVAHLLDLLSLKSTVKQDGAVLSLVQEFIAGVDIGLAVPIANAVAISLAEELAKVAKKDRLGMLAVIQSLVEQPDPEIKSRRYQALFAPADEALVGA